MRQVVRSFDSLQNHLRFTGKITNNTKRSKRIAQGYRNKNDGSSQGEQVNGIPKEGMRY